MNKVSKKPILPMSVGDKNFIQQLLKHLGDHAQAINDAADGRLGVDVAVTGTYAAAVGELMIFVSPAAPCTETLPNVRDTKNMMVRVKRANNTTHTITVNTVAGNIDGAASVTLTTAYQCRTFYSDGTAYHLIT